MGSRCQPEYQQGQNRVTIGERLVRRGQEPLERRTLLKVLDLLKTQASGVWSEILLTTFSCTTELA